MLGDLIFVALVANVIGRFASPTWRGVLNWYLLGRPSVILKRDGQLKTSLVRSLGSHFWVSWYAGIEKIELKPDGTASDPPFHYKWEPLVPKNKDWFVTAPV